MMTDNYPALCMHYRPMMIKIIMNAACCKLCRPMMLDNYLALCMHYQPMMIDDPECNICLARQILCLVQVCIKEFGRLLRYNYSVALITY